MPALAVPQTSEVQDEVTTFAQWLTTSGIFGTRKTVTTAARSKWAARRKTYSTEEIKAAFLNLLNEPDRWKIKNNGGRPLAWWLHSDERIEDMKGCHLKKITNKNFSGVAFISQ